MAKKLKTSAALLAYRQPGRQDDVVAIALEVLIVHPGGPFWARKDDGVWSIPKGEFDPESEDGLSAAQREFAEELGSSPPEKGYLDLGSITQKAGKTVHAWAVPCDLDADAIASNTFSMEWPPKSGKMAEFPEVDRAAWVTPEVAAVKLNAAQVPLVERLVELLR